MNLLTATLTFICSTSVNAFSTVGRSASLPLRHSMNASSRTGTTHLNSDLKSIAERVLENPKWPEEWPYTERDLARMDESVDTIFYESPRLVYHIDDFAVDALTKYYKENIKDGEGEKIFM